MATTTTTTNTPTSQSHTKNKVLFIFRRDYRLQDNIGLYNASHKFCKNSGDELYPIFIFTPEQVANNPYASKIAIQFLIESLADLERDISQKTSGKLTCFYGENEQIISRILREKEITHVCFNRDYTPYSVKRDTDIQKLCERQNVICETWNDAYLFDMKSINKLDKTDISYLDASHNTTIYYKKFTPFYENALSHFREIPLPVLNPPHRNRFRQLDAISGKIELTEAYQRFAEINAEAHVQGGRTEGIKHLSKAISRFVKTPAMYAKIHDQLTDETTNLSAYIKFGCLSIREVFHKLKPGSKELIRQLIWREFYGHCLYIWPETIDTPFINQHRRWSGSRSAFEKWKRGTTGIDIVDAAMTQMNRTGYMHNRGRLIVSSYLINNLKIDWRDGAKYFSQKLIDIDITNNIGNWRWMAEQPEFKALNVETQAKKFDKEKEYRRQWLRQDEVDNEDEER